MDTKTKGTKVNRYELVSDFYNLRFRVFIKDSKFNVWQGYLHDFRVWQGKVGRNLLLVGK